MKSLFAVLVLAAIPAHASATFVSNFDAIDFGGNVSTRVRLGSEDVVSGLVGVSLGEPDATVESDLMPAGFARANVSVTQLLAANGRGASGTAMMGMSITTDEQLLPAENYLTSATASFYAAYIFGINRAATLSIAMSHDFTGALVGGTGGFSSYGVFQRIDGLGEGGADIPVLWSLDLLAANASGSFATTLVPGEYYVAFGSVVQGMLGNGSLTGQASHNFSLAPSGVPEPQSWALLVAGFGLAGAALRRQRMAVVA